MKRKNASRNALFTSIISLLLCVSMLVGTTFAWFTDEVTSANNIIKSGNLDVELYYQAEGQNDWTKVDANSNIFKENTLWEPGHTEVVKLKVVNEGTLALKYQLGVNVASETGSVNMAGKDFLLSDHIKFGVVDGAQTYTREQAVAAVEQSATALNVAYTAPTAELPAASANATTAANEAVVTMVVYMPTSVGNEANYGKGAAVPTINLGINLFATQLEAESDSFGPDYDEDAWNNAMKVSSPAELAAAIKEVEDGGTIGLLESITFDEDSVMDNSGYNEGIIFEGDKSFTIDLNGKTITNDSAVNDYLVYIRNNGSKPNTITFKNGTIEATSSAYAAIATASSNAQKITINLENVAVKGNNSNGAVIKARGGAELNVKAGTVITGANNYVGIEGVGANTVINVYEGAKLYQNGTSSYVGALLGVSYNATANVYGGSGTSAKGGFIVMTSGGTINVSGGEWKANTDGTPKNDNFGVLIAQYDNATYPDAIKSTVNVTGGIFYGGYNCYANVADKSEIAISGGKFNADPKDYLDDGYKAVESSGAWTVVPENAIATSNDLIAAINTAADGDTLLLAPGEYELAFTNDTTFNVDNLIIEGMGNTKLAITSTEVGYGRIQGSKVTFKNITFTSNSKGNAVGATGEATYTNCTFECAKVECASGGNNLTYFNNCEINGTLHTSVDFSSGDTYVTDSKVAKAEYSGAATMYFTNCEIGELISWNMNTVLENCDVANIDMQHMTDGDIVTVTTAEDGLAYATSSADPSAKILYDVPADYAESTVTVPEGVTAIGNFAFTANKNVETVTLPSTIKDLGRGFDSNTSVKKVVLNEGLETIAPRAFKATTALEEVVISSTVKTIDDDAFQKTGLKNITIPAKVEYVGAQAFGASKIETVIFEGNPIIQNKAFRCCAALKTVYFNGDDVTFENTTGQANCWFCHSESSNPNTSEITFYVKNETVAAKVKAAMGKDIEKVKIFVNGALYTK